MASLEKYFDQYSARLDLVARKHSALNDTFLILDRKLTDNFKTLSSEVDKLSRQLGNLSSNNAKGNTTEKATRGNSKASESIEAQQKDSASTDDKSTSRYLNNITEILIANKKVLEDLHEKAKEDKDSKNLLLRYVSQISDRLNKQSDGQNQTTRDELSRLRQETTQQQVEGNVQQLASADAARGISEYIPEDRAELTDLDTSNSGIEDILMELRPLRDLMSRYLESNGITAEDNLAGVGSNTGTAGAEQTASNPVSSTLSEDLRGKMGTEEIKADEDFEKIAEQELESQKAALLLALNNQSILNSSNGTLSKGEAENNAKAVEEQFKESEERLTEIRKRNALAASDPALVEANEKKKAALIAKLELEHKKKNNGQITALERQGIIDKVNKEFQLSEENIKKLRKEQLKAEKDEAKKEKQAHRQKTDSIVSAPLTKENSLLQHIKDLSKASEEKTTDGSGGKKLVAALDTAVATLGTLLAKLEKTIDSVAMYKGDIDTRLQGSKNEQFKGSYWGQLTKDMMSVGAVTPYFKQEKFAENIKSLVDQGIAFDLKQRAFLMTIQEKIANTFNVADGTLLRLVRIQQEDSTAGRLGMESALNSFLNNMYENTEYLKTVAEGVRSSLQEMEALMTGAEATEVEYQVQKWMGSLYSVGMSQEAVNNISSALGQIAAGQVDALTNGSGSGNLLVMAANRAGKPISEILAEGLDAQETNELLQAAVDYLAELAEASKDSRVVQQQLASVYGVKASDLKAALNLTSDGVSSDNIFKEYLTYDNMLKQLNDMAGTMHLRTSLGEMMQNVWANGQYTLASSMANNPAAYLLYKVASLLDATTGGIPLPFISAAGFGVDLETTVADLMRVASLSTGIIGSFGQMIEGLSNSFSGQSMLEQMDIKQGSGLKVNIRGTGDGITASEASGGGAQTTSSSGYVGNSSGSDIKESTIQEAEDSKKQQMIEALEEEQAHQIDYINENVLKIYELLDEVTNGKKAFNVKVAGYGLTSNGSLVGSQGGASGQLNVTTSNSGSNNLGGNTSSSSGSSSSESNYTITKGIDLGGWTMM